MESEPLAGMPARFRKVPYRAVRDASLPAGALRLLIAIACNADGDGRCDLEADRMAMDVGLTPEEIARYSEQLAQLHYVSAARDDRRWQYQLVSDPEANDTEAGSVRHPPTAKPAGGRSRGVNRLMRAWRDADRFSFWLRTVLPPDDTDLFWAWALSNEDDYHTFVQRFGDAKDDSALESLLRETADVIASVSPAHAPTDLEGRSSAA
jgi:hypothetical protein